MKRFTAGRLAAALVVLLAVLVTGCASNADKVSKNLGKECEKFECQRKIVAVNGITNDVLLEAEGRCSVEDGPLLRSLEITCKHGPNDYRKHFVGLSDNTTYTVTQLAGLDVSEYRTKFIFRPEGIIPDFDLVTGDGG